MLSNLNLERAFGWGAIFCSAFFFYFATVVIRLAEPEVDIHTSYYAFFRFLLGFMVVASVVLVKRKPIKVKNLHYLLGRMVGNTVAVYAFYQAAVLGSVAEANILNMSYPIFVTIVSWIMYKQQRDIKVVGLVILACVGVWLVLSPEQGFKVSQGSLWGLASGVFASAAIIYLNLCRKEHDSNTILLFLFGLGAFFMALLFHEHLFWPNGKELFYLVLCGASGIIGQYCITFGFRYVTAVEGSVISSTRILLAALLGPVLIGEAMISAVGWFGAICIFVANVALALLKR
ncbi:MAG: DMT family transporter [Desulfotalea sp.]